MKLTNITTGVSTSGISNRSDGVYGIELRHNREVGGFNTLHITGDISDVGLFFDDDRDVIAFKNEFLEAFNAWEKGRPWKDPRW